jgi:cardiolipin synthase
MFWVAAANVLTAARLIALPFLVEAIRSRQFGLALTICVVAGLTDTADGNLARRSGAVTRFGAYFDPIADKIFLGIGYLVLAEARLVPWWLVAIVFGRDLLILLSASILIWIARHRDFPPSRLGKFSTLLQISLMFFVLFHQVAQQTETAQIVQALLYGVAVVTLWSGVHYAWLISRRLGSSVLPIDAPVPRE